jgi:hypothetical protein
VFLGKDPLVKTWFCPYKRGKLSKILTDLDFCKDTTGKMAMALLVDCWYNRMQKANPPGKERWRDNGKSIVHQQAFGVGKGM